jgi:hypothetical protein
VSITGRRHFRKSIWSFYTRMVLNTTNDTCGDESIVADATEYSLGIGNRGLKATA